MFNKLVWFMFLFALAALIGIFGPNQHKTIECNNSDKICKTYSINSVLKTKTLKKTVKVDTGYGYSWHVMGVGQNNIKNLSCHKRSYTTRLRDGSTRNRVKYLLVPIGKTNALYAINEYSSNTSCEVDRLAIQSYLSSNNNEPFVYVVNGSWFRYLWYLVAAFLIIIASLILFKGRVLSKTEEKQLENLISEEEFEQMHQGLNNIIKHISNIDEIGAKTVNEIKNQYDKHHIDIKQDKD